MTLRDLNCTVDRDGVAVITLRAPQGLLPVIDEATIEELEALVDRIADDSAVTGGVITGHDGQFCVGADPRLMERLISDYRADEARRGAEEARKLGLVEEMVREGEALARAKAWIAGGGRGIQAFDVKGFRTPGGEVYSPRGLMVWPVANAVYRKDTFDNFQARRAVLHAVY